MLKKILLNPIEKYSENQLFLFGIIFLLIGSYVSSFCHVNFDGFFDLHFSNYQLSFAELLAQNLINIVVLFICLYLAGIYRYKKTRMIDMLNTVLTARIPFYFLSLFNVKHSLSVNPSMPINELIDFAMDNLFLMMSMSVLMIMAMIWMVTLLYSGYKIATNAKGNTAIILFIVALIAAEAISKLIIYKTML
jgi:hypothetical protein